MMEMTRKATREGFGEEILAWVNRTKIFML